MRTLLVRLAVALGTPHGASKTLVTHPRHVVLVLVAALPPVARQDRCRVAFVWHGLPLFAAPLQGLFVTVRTMTYFRCVLFVTNESVRVAYEGVDASQGGRAVASVDCMCPRKYALQL